MGGKSSRAYFRAWHAAHPGYAARQSQKFRDTNIERNRLAQRAYKNKNSTAVKASRNAWRQKNPRKYKGDHYRHKFGLTLSELQAMLAQQGNGCAICHTSLTMPARSTHVDHCHRTGVVRGILCRRCNQQLGHFEQWPEFALHAAAYLERTNA